MSRVTWHNADYAHGPAIAVWIRTLKIPHLEHRDRKCAMFWRAVRRWEDGARVSIFVLDRWLTVWGYHLSEVPDTVYVPGKGRRAVWAKGRLSRPPIPAEVKDRARELLAEGELSVREIAAKVGINESSVRHLRPPRKKVAA